MFLDVLRCRSANCLTGNKVAVPPNGVNVDRRTTPEHIDNDFAFLHTEDREVLLAWTLQLGPEHVAAGLAVGGRHSATSVLEDGLYACRNLGHLRRIAQYP